MGANDVYLAKPWLKHYPEGVPPTVEVPLKSLAVNMTVKISDYGTPVTIEAPANPQPTKALGGALLGAMFSMVG